jgi:spermidine/putrescine transport system permease protein
MRFVIWLLCAWTVIVLLFLYGPIVVLGASSINRSITNSTWDGATMQWYRVLWHGSLLELKEKGAPVDWLGAGASSDAIAEIRKTLPATYRNRITGSVGEIVNAMFNSLLIAAVVAVIATALGTTAAWLLHRFRYPLSRLLNTLVAVPMIVPEIILGISLLILFASIDFELGFTTVIIAHITFCFPYVMLTVQARLSGLDPAMEEAAMDLGATPLMAFCKVIVPYLLPAIISGALMAFTLSMDDFVVTYFTYSARAKTFPIEVYGSVRFPNPLISTVSTLLVGVTAVLVIVSEIIKGRSKLAEVKK